jgi:hypothetical protein
VIAARRDRCSSRIHSNLLRLFCWSEQPRPRRTRLRWPSCSWARRWAGTSWAIMPACSVRNILLRVGWLGTQPGQMPTRRPASRREMRSVLSLSPAADIGPYWHNSRRRQQASYVRLTSCRQRILHAHSRASQSVRGCSTSKRDTCLLHPEGVSIVTKKLK